MEGVWEGPKESNGSRRGRMVVPLIASPGRGVQLSMSRGRVNSKLTCESFFGHNDDLQKMERSGQVYLWEQMRKK